MSDYLPFEIQVQIIQRLPLKSVIQFRSVSKTWKSLIDSSSFIASYGGRQRLVIRYEDPVESEEKYVSFVDDDNFPSQKSYPTVPLFFKQLNSLSIVGSSQGLLCLEGYYVEPGDSLLNFKYGMAVLWNPSIRKSVAVAVPEVLYPLYQDILGFGVCPGTSDPKIIHLRKRRSKTCTPWQVKVVTFSSGAWTNRSSCLPPRKSIDFMTNQAVIDKFIYWPAFDRIPIGDGFQDYRLIMSFDLNNDEFKEVYLPDSLTLEPHTILSICKIKNSLGVIEFRNDLHSHSLPVWVMDHGVPHTFQKMFTIQAPVGSSINNMLGFRKTGEPVIEVMNDDTFSEIVPLFVYDPYSEHINKIGIYGTDHSFFMESYMETLLLLNEPDHGSYLCPYGIESDESLRSV